MADHAVELNVAGQKCRVVSSAGEEELEILARMVEEKLARIVPPGRPVTTQAVILAAVALANDVRSERQRADAIAAKAKASLETMLGRVESVLGEGEAPSSASPASLRAPSSASPSSLRAPLQEPPSSLRAPLQEPPSSLRAPLQDPPSSVAPAKKGRRDDTSKRSDGE